MGEKDLQNAFNVWSVGLQRFQVDFEKDFSFRDVQDELKELIGRNYLHISNEKSNKQKIEKLFYILIYVINDAVTLGKFMKILEKSYSWLYSCVIKSENDKWIQDYHRAVKDIPNNQDWNIHRIDYLFKIQQSLKALQRGQYLVLFGKVGFGKRWLAADACRNYGIVSKMNFKIYWLNASKCSSFEAVLSKLQRLKVLMQTDNIDIKYSAQVSTSTKNEIINLRNHLRTILEQPEYKDCLIVLTDVQDEKIVNAFDLNCKILITTRHSEWITNQEKIDIDIGMTIDESTALFTKLFGNTLPSDMPQYVKQLHEKCDGHPFILSRIAMTFQNFEENVVGRTERCKTWLQKLTEYNFKDNSNQINMSIEESIKFLSKKYTNYYGYYKMLVIFTDNLSIPINVLGKLWGTDSHETENLVITLHKYSLIEKPIVEDNDKSVSLHYLHFKYLREVVPKREQREFHRQLIKSYDLENIYRNRTELELDLPSDNYFYFYIGSHLHGAEMHDLFAIYHDFGFLEQKIRASKLPNTLGDLTTYAHSITNNDVEKLQLNEELLLFLPSVEDFIVKSSDVSLLQYALTSQGRVKLEAEKQSKKYNDRVWMNDINHGDNPQIIVLQEGFQPQIVRFAKPDNLVLISLQNNNILLHDIALHYSNNPVLYQNELPSSSTITDMQVFKHEAFLTLNENGKLMVHKIKENYDRRPTVPQKKITTKPQAEKHLQRIEYQSDKITCFNVVDPSVNNTDLIIGSDKGEIRFYKWHNHKFEDQKNSIKTKFEHLFRMAHINDYIMLLNKNGDMKFFNLKNSQSLLKNIPPKELKSPINLHQGICKHTNKFITVCVTQDKVVQFTHDGLKHNVVFLNYDEIYLASECAEIECNEILSSTMSKDAEYLILGTTRGILIINRFKKKIISRRNVSDQVLSMDVFKDDVCYVLISVFKDSGHILNIQSIASGSSEMDEKTFLVGDEIFDVKNPNVTNCEFVAVDTRGNIHRRNGNDLTKSYNQTPFSYQIKKICFQGEEIIIGCTTGSVYKVDENEPLATLMSEITYLECFDDSTVIASCNSSFKVLGVEKDFDGKVTKAYKFSTDMLLLVKKDCSIEFFDVKKRTLDFQRILANGTSCSSQTFQDSMVVIATAQNDIYAWQIGNDFDSTQNVSVFNPQSKYGITSLALSYDNNHLAIGYSDGSIEIFELTNRTSLKVMKSHSRMITQLKFCPWNETRGPLVLMSLSESIIFWNVSYIINNQPSLKRIDDSMGHVRVSARFRNKLSVVPENLTIATQNLSLTERNPWNNKVGSADKRELLTCIKFIGKSAKKVVTNNDFTRFITIDNEGNVYDLKMIDNSSIVSQRIFDFNGNSNSIK